VACGRELLGDGAADIARRSRDEDLQGVSPWRLPANLPVSFGNSVGVGRSRLPHAAHIEHQGP
jgi:hypothetical protein